MDKSFPGSFSMHDSNANVWTSFVDMVDSAPFEVSGSVAQPKKATGLAGRNDGEIQVLLEKKDVDFAKLAKATPIA